MSEHVLPLKFCGFTRAEDLAAAALLKVFAVGLNFYPDGKRYVSPKQAAELLAAADLQTFKPELWGVFVNEEPRRIAEIAAVIGLDAVQLSGDESPAAVSAVREALSAAEESLSALGKPFVKIVKSLRGGRNTLFSQAAEYTGISRPNIFLIDAFVPGEYGGTGKRADWAAAVEFCASRPETGLAGGITPENAARAFKTVQPGFIDSASGIEEPGRPGIKSISKMKAFAAGLRDVVRDME